MGSSTHRAIRVLLIEDDDDDAFLTESALKEVNGARFSVIRAKTLVSGIDCLIGNAVDAVLLDLVLPDSRGLESLIRLRGESVDVPIVVLTGLADEETAIESLQHGAQDYLAKSNLSGKGVSHSIQHAIERQRLVTSLRNANQQLNEKNVRLADLCETAHRFVDNVSHEFRTPLTVIKEFASLLNEGLCGTLTQMQRRSAQTISDRADDLTLLVNDMMDVSRLKAGILGMWRVGVRISDVVRHVRAMLERRAARNHVELEIAVADDLPAVYCDAGKIGQVITNLVVNAIKFTGDHCQVRLWARVDSPARVTVGITDNGPGIAPDKLSGIFERFTQLHHDVDASTKGVGLGLSIVRDFVGLNLGTLSVDSSVGRGTTFCFTLPQARGAAVLDCYLAALQKKNPRATVRLLEACVDDPCDMEAITAVDKFLQGSGCPEDVVYSISPGRWLLLRSQPIALADDELEALCAAWAEARRNWTHGPPPELSLSVHGNWRLDTAAGLRAQFGALENQSDERNMSAGNSTTGGTGANDCHGVHGVEHDLELV